MLAMLLAHAALAAPCDAGDTITLSDTDGSIVLTQEEYTDNLDLCWNVAPTCPLGADLVLRASDVDIEVGYDTLQVTLGGQKGALDIEAGDAHTTTSSMRVHFHTDESTTRGGFTLAYQCQEAAPPEEEPLEGEGYLTL